MLGRAAGFLLLIFAVVVRSLVVRVVLLQLAVEGRRLAGVMFFLFDCYCMSIAEYDDRFTASLLLLSMIGL